ncbi:putative multidrug ABC transporter ATP-binding protein YbhF [BD1-7 clade bacterium]|uniref:Putative multidrug ABC transporter ATP-binding protein YbhF n=1 Tax=BD1-7 clade bacterium TaxID=2029982 RepID=A0A5S9R066_9GAMM|nr:putative multidrug ABC transporter ATP-binding protein YbhF [BD1-7 clade bacterium]
MMDTTNDLAIETCQLTRRFGKFTAVDKLDLQIPKGCIYGFLGPNGCGKSTTIRMLLGLLEPTEGAATVLGLSLPTQAEALRTHVGYMTQTFSLYTELTVSENLKFVANVYGLNHRQQKTRLEELLSIYDLNAKAHEQAGSLSGGQRQRLALAAATLHKPQLLFLDEPTSAVDPENRRSFWEQLFDLSDAGTTILVSTHYMDEAERCVSLAILEAGVLRAEGSPQKLMHDLQANVIEIDGTDLRQLKQHLLCLDDVISAAQQGIRLRVLVNNRIQDPITWLRQQSALVGGQKRHLTRVHASLEDVFVNCTGAVAATQVRA